MKNHDNIKNTGQRNQYHFQGIFINRLNNDGSGSLQVPEIRVLYIAFGPPVNYLRVVEVLFSVE
jgi:hypothetical protein